MTDQTKAIKGNLSKIFCSVIFVEIDLYIQVIELT